MHNNLKQKGSSERTSAAPQFTVNRGWFNWFLHSVNLNSLRTIGEAANADTTDTEQYPAMMKKVIKDSSYSP